MGTVCIGNKKFSCQHIEVRDGVLTLYQDGAVVHSQPFKQNSGIFLRGAHVYDLEVVCGYLCYNYMDKRDKSYVFNLRAEMLAIQGISYPDFDFNQRVECHRDGVAPDLNGYDNQILVSGNIHTVCVSNKNHSWISNPHTSVIMSASKVEMAKVDFAYLKFKPYFSCACYQYLSLG